VSDTTIVYLVLAAVVVVFMLDRLPVAVVAVGTALSLWATGVLTLDQALAGFGDPTTLFIAALFVVAEALDATGITGWVGQQLTARSGSSLPRMLVLTMLVSALLTVVLTPNGAVAALVPAVAVLAVRTHRSPSRILMPLAFASMAGSMLTLTASPVNVIVSNAADDAGVGTFGFFEFALVGVPLLAGTIAIVLLVGGRLLPARTPKTVKRDFSQHARTLVEQYGLDSDPGALFTRRYGKAEVVIPPRSGLIGEVAFPGMVTESGDLVVVAIQRQEEVRAGETTLQVGDTLLLRGSWGDLDHHMGDPDVIAVDDPDAVRRQAVPLGPGAGRSFGILVAMIVLLAFGALPAAVAGLLAAGSIVVFRVLSIEQAYHGIQWTTVILIGGMIPLSTAMAQTGAAEHLADGLLDVVGDLGPRALLAGLVIIIFVLGQLISNTATVLVVIPVALSAAAELDVSTKPVLMTVCVASGAAFLTPIATPANLMVMEPGGYRFGDYWKLGLPLMGLYAIVAVFVVPLIWSF
jgi:di/tricarboxylate transporter